MKLKTVATPFINEDQKEAAARKPISDGSALQCPWCAHSFPAPDFQPPKKGKKSKEEGVEPPTAGGHSGKLQPLAASVLMKILYAARMARFDLLRATCKLACFTTRWDADCDKRIYRLVCYINSSLSKRPVSYTHLTLPTNREV